jgi:hypothetical protein
MNELLNKNNLRGTSVIERTATDYFSSKAELDSSIASLKIEFNHTFEDFGLEQPLKDHPDVHEQSSKVPQYKNPRRKLRTRRPKRGNSLEREIAKHILDEAQRTNHSNLQQSVVEELSTKDILSDLVRSQKGTLNHPIQSSRDSTATDNNENMFLTKTNHSSCFKQDSNSTALNFDTENEEWATFNNSSLFCNQLQPSKKVDNDGFLVSTGTKHDKDNLTRVSFGVETKRESSSSEPPSKADWTNEDDKQSEKARIDEHVHRESPSVIFSDDKSLQSECRTSVLCLSESPTSRPCKLETKQSPSSVANFAAGIGYNGPKTVGPYLLKYQNSDKPVASSKLSWSPKPPKHLNHYNEF